MKYDLANVLEARSDLLVIPCTSNGKVPSFGRDELLWHGVPWVPRHLPVGTVKLLQLTDSRNPPTRTFAGLCFAAVISRKSVTAERMRQIGSGIGHIVRKHGMKIVTFPALGAEVRGIDLDEQIDALVSGLESSLLGMDVELIIHLTDIRDFRRKSQSAFDTDVQAQTIFEKTDSSTARTALRTQVFVSYARRDKRWLERVHVHLRPLEREHIFTEWDDTKIRPGTNWREEIQVAIRKAKIAILLVSADFLASDFIAQNELPPLLKAAEEDGAVILPLIVSPCRFTSTEGLARFQAVNDPARPLNSMRPVKREETFLRLVDAVEAAFRC